MRPTAPTPFDRSERPERSTGRARAGQEGRYLIGCHGVSELGLAAAKPVEEGWQRRLVQRAFDVVDPRAARCPEEIAAVDVDRAEVAIAAGLYRVDRRRIQGPYLAGGNGEAIDGVEAAALVPDEELVLLEPLVDADDGPHAMVVGRDGRGRGGHDTVEHEDVL